AEDGIRDKLVTGVQTCALPICVNGDDEIDLSCLIVRDNNSQRFDLGLALRLVDVLKVNRLSLSGLALDFAVFPEAHIDGIKNTRSEERRVGKECRMRRGAENEK